jgi:2-phosphosulfolactate phosphatase
MTEPTVRGKTIVLTTTNGTKALLACQGAAAAYAACAANFSVVVERAREALDRDERLLVVCAGRDGAFSLDDAYCAGRLAAAALEGAKPRRGLNDAAIASLALARRYGDSWERPLRTSRAGRELIKRGFQDDVLDASRFDAYPVLAHFHERRITLAPVPV